MSAPAVPVDAFKVTDLHECTLYRCARGWLIRSGGARHGDLMLPMFAFDRIEDVAAFLVESLSTEVQQ